MVRIFKYRLEIVNVQEIDMPQRATIISAQMQDGDLCVWALVDDGEPIVKRQFLVLPTGSPMLKGYSWRHLATVQVQGLVWHVFEV